MTKVHGGHDDQTLERLQKELKMKKIAKNWKLVPDWLDVKPQQTPDFVTLDPLTSQVWEITGAEFSKAEAHTANGISIRLASFDIFLHRNHYLFGIFLLIVLLSRFSFLIFRFPRVTKIRDDKLPEDATTLAELEKLYKTSKEQILVLDEEVGDHDEIEDSEEDLKGQDSEAMDDNEGSGDEEQKSAAPSKPTKRKSRPCDTRESDSDCDPSESSTRRSSSRKKIKTEESPTKFDRKKSTAKAEPQDSNDLIKQEKLPPCNLPDVFSGIVIEKLPGDPKQYENLRRYFVAYGGTLSDAGITHHIGTTRGTTKVEWLLESVKRRRLLEENDFRN